MKSARATLIAIAAGQAGAAVSAQTCGSPWSVWSGTGAPIRSLTAVAYDSARARTVLFGGSPGGVVYGETLEFDSAGSGVWTLRATSGPPAMYGASMAYDSVRHSSVLFGGRNFTTAAFGETWEWDGTTWVHAQPTASPPPMVYAPMAFDPVRARVVLVSAIAGSPGTWEYDGLTWTQAGGQTPEATPVGVYSAMAYDAARSRMVLLVPDPQLFNSLQSATWERDGTTWTRIATGTMPWGASGSGLVFDTGLQSVLCISSGLTWRSRADLGSWHLLQNGSPLEAYGNVVYDSVRARTISVGNGTALYDSSVRSGPTLTDVGPHKLSVPSGTSVTLSAAAEGSGTLSFQWRLNNVPLNDGGAFSGTHTAHLTVNPFSLPTVGGYDAIVTDSCGSTTLPWMLVDTGCYPNCDNGNIAPVLNANDFQCFLSNYATGCDYWQCYANCDQSTQIPFLTANDFQCFLNKYAAGCT